MKLLDKNLFKLPGININSFEKLDELFNNATSNIDNSLEALKLYKEIHKFMDILDGINSKGFINKTNLKVYPLINECIDLLLKDYKDYEKLQYKYGKTHGSTVQIGDNLYKVRDAMIFYR